ncbi:MAG: 1-hydroxycarotenoid 3,4-desaturase CrtD [Tunicatimonas sp.]|uniref:1-hydroxycarotenoid 3,4-desaturase CrtD n=1 Tax=Tunicatimonas sp. TaxID=1940096 RepID=UPI003C780546
MVKRAGIVGAGIAGIASAIRLANKGYHVDVYEANTYPGGKLSEIKLGDYRFDAGPSLFTLPELVDELFTLSGEQIQDHFEYQHLPVACHYFYEDGTFLKAYADREKFLEEVSQKTTESSQTIQAALDRSSYLYDTLSDLFMKRSLHRWQTFVNKKAWRAYSKLHRLDFFRSMHQANQQQFQDKRVVQLFNRYATYNGSNPYEAPATMNIIPHLEFNIGAYFPTRGMYSITDSLYKLAQRLGVRFHFQSQVKEIETDNSGVKGINVAGEIQHYDVVVSNMDVVNTYRKLLPKVKPPTRLLNQPKSSSALIFYWGVNHSFPELDLHNIFFSQNYQQEFEHIFQKKTIYHDPTVYVNITAKYKTDDAPPGAENWFTMINVPNNEGQDWDALINQARNSIIDKVSNRLGVNVGSKIVAEDILDPRTIESRTSSSQGALYGNSSNNRYAAFLRHANFSRKIKGLYFCGGSVHPGGGIPLSLLSAKIAVDQIK